MTDPLKLAKDSVTLTGELIKAAGDNPNVKEAGNNLGEAALTLSKTINNALIPLAALNFAVDKAKTYFSGRFQEDLSKKASAIPPDQIVEPKPSVAGPALQGLAFSHEEPNLKDMYLSLLATAMNGSKSLEAHPAFVEIIKQLTADEAYFLKTLLNIPGMLPIVRVHTSKPGEKGVSILMYHLTDIKNMVTGFPEENPALPVMFDNWVRLGLIEIDYSRHLTDPQIYEWVTGRPEFVRMKAEQETVSARVSFDKGCVRKTALGAKFANAVGLALTSA